MNPVNGFWRDRRVLVTGGAGLIGHAFIEQLVEAGARVQTVQHRRPVPFGSEVVVLEGDLRHAATCRRAVEGTECVIHAAGVSGGSKQVGLRPIPMFTDNLLMNTQVLEAARLADVAFYLFVSNSSVYASSDALLREEDAWGETTVGVPENETGVVKRAGETQCALYARHANMRIAIIRPGNAYGPHDNFDLDASHVVPALVRKAAERHDPYTVWGSGEAVRDFVHVRDLARGGLFVLERARPGECFPVNIATGRAISIRELVGIILRAADYEEPRVVFQGVAPPASGVKRMDVSRMCALGFEPQISLENGLRETVEWYRKEARA